LSQLLAVRIRDFGGVLHKLAPGATLRGDRLCLLAFRTRSRFDYWRFLLAVIFRRQTFTRQIELLTADSVECRAREDAGTRIFTEADGELLGDLPMRIDVVPDGVYLLIPPSARL
jgi:diacylglycerol kinase family enzyme